MSESADYTATNWVPSHDYTSARAAYTDSVVNRSYANATSAKVAARDLVAKDIKINDPTLVIVSDVTGSMGTWPAVMFGKLPYLTHELKTYLGDKAALLVAAVGDANSDQYPLQVQEPKKTFDESLAAFKALVVEGNGGGQNHESYELVAGFFKHAVTIAPGIPKPILVFIGDELPYDTVSGEQLRKFGVNVETQSTTDLFKALNEVYDVYLIHKPYAESWNHATTVKCKETWGKLLPPQHVLPLQEPERVVDVIFGILANATDNEDYFKKELAARQTLAQTNTVLTSLHGLYGASTPKKLGSGKSTFHKAPAGKPSKPLL